MEDEASTNGELRKVPLMTEKGYSHRRNVLWSQMQRTFKVLQRQIQILDSLTASTDSGDPEMVIAESGTLGRLHRDITDANNQFASCVKKGDPTESEETEDNERSNWVEEVDRLYFDCKNRICAWLGEQYKAQSTSSKQSKQSRASIKTKDNSKTMTPQKEEPDLGLAPMELNITSDAPMMADAALTSGNGEFPRRKLLLTQMKRSSKLMGKQIEIIDALFSSSDVDAINTETSTLDRLHHDISDANAQLQWCFAQEDQSGADLEDPKVQELWMEGIDEAYFQQKQKICNWLIKKDKTLKANRKQASSVLSTTCSSRASKRSCASGSSRASKRSKGGSDVSLASRISTEQRAKIASLKAEADMLQRTKEAELNAEMLTIQKKIAKAEAKAQVYAEEERRFAFLSEAVKGDKSKFPSPEKKVALETAMDVPMQATTTMKKPLEITPETPVVVPMSVAGHEVLQETMTKMLKVQAAPTVILDVFSGDPLEYAYFKATFKEVVEKTVDDQKGRLTRLIQYTCGEAKNLIKHLIHIPGDGYDQALKILDAEYGDVHTVTNSYLKELRLWPSIRPNDTVAFKKFHQFLVKCLTYKEGNRLLELDSTDVIRTLVLKLHSGYHERWNRAANKIRLKRDCAATFKDFVDFIEGEKKLLCNPMYSKDALAECQTKLKSNNTLLSKMEPENDATSKEVKFSGCYNCGGDHDIEDCQKYLDLPVDERHKLVFLKKLCFSCLQPITDQHKAQQCTAKRQCKACSKTHPTTLHGDKSFSSNAVTSTTEMVSMCIVKVELWHPEEGKAVSVYALLDECCQGTLIREDIIDVMGVTNIKHDSISIETVVGADVSQGLYVEGLKVKGVAPFTQHYEEIEIELPSTFLRPFLAMGEDDVATPTNIKNWDYLDKIKHMIPEYDASVPFGLMIGGNCPLANEPWEFVHSQGKGPYAKRTPLGWCVIGPISSEGRIRSMKSNFTKMVSPCRDVSNNKIPAHYFHFQSSIYGSITSQLLQDMYLRERVLVRSCIRFDYIL